MRRNSIFPLIFREKMQGVNLHEREIEGAFELCIEKEGTLIGSLVNKSAGKVSLVDVTGVSLRYQRNSIRTVSRTVRVQIS